MDQLTQFFSEIVNLNQFEPGEAFIDLRLRRSDGRWTPVKCFTVEEAVRSSEELRSEGDVFFGVCPRRKGAALYPTRGDVIGANVLWADLDLSETPIDGVQAWDSVQNQVLPPTAAVATGHGLHLYWALPALVRDSAVVEELNRAIAKGTPHADDTVDLGRILRVPGSLNYKADPPRPVGIVHVDYATQYSLGAVRGFFGVPDDVRSTILSGDVGDMPSRSERDWDVLTALAMVSTPYEAVEELFTLLPIGDKYRESGAKYLTRSYQKASSRATKVRSLERWGICLADDAYWKVQRRGKQGGLTRISTFAFQLQKVLHGADQDILVGRVHAGERAWDDIQFPRNAFVNVNAFSKHLPLAEWAWTGNDEDVRKLLPLTLESTPNVEAVRATYTLGWNEDHWVGTTQTVSPEGRLLTGSDAPIVFVDPKRVAPIVEYENIDGELDLGVLETLERINRPEVIWPVISWYVAAFLKPKLEAHGLRFPILHVYGTRGSGKTTLLKEVMQPFVGVTNPTAYNCNTTHFVLMSLLGSSNAVPVSLTEFRESTLQANEYARILRLLLMSYDAGTDARGRADQTTVTYELTAPITLDGEDLLADPAMMERTVVVNMKPATVMPGAPCSLAFQELDVTALKAQSGPLLRHCITADLSTLVSRATKAVQEAFKDLVLPERVVKNHIVLAVGLLAFHDFMGKSEQCSQEFIAQILLPTVDNVVSKGLGRTRLVVDEMIEDIASEVLQGTSRFHYKYEPEDNVLWIHLTSVVSWWLEKRRRQGRASLQKAAIKAQLRERSQTEEGEMGRYVLERKGKSIKGSLLWCYGISIDACMQAGLDIPDQLSTTQVVINLSGG